MKEKANTFQLVPKPTLLRLPGYLNYLKTREKDDCLTISSAVIAKDLEVNHVQVRKDLAFVSKGGRPKTGYAIIELTADIKSFLGYDNLTDALLVGAGNLGKTLLSYNGFSDYGLNVLAAFDTDERIIGANINGKPIYALDKLVDLRRRLNVNIGIITVPEPEAQKVCDLLVASGISAIWNFAPVHVYVPHHVIVQNENMAASLALLANKLSDSIRLQDNQK